jgi:hypothetical protein
VSREKMYLFCVIQIKPILTIIGPYTTLKNKEKAITLNWINSAVKLGSLRIQLQNIQAWGWLKQTNNLKINVLLYGKMWVGKRCTYSV